MIRAALIAAFVGGVALVSAQTPAPSPSAVTFEVASIKPAVPGQPTASDRFSPERFYSRNTTLLTLVRLAYGWLPSFRVSGGPEWVTTDLWEVNAKANGVPTVPQQRDMIRRLLEDRFALRVRFEMREMPIYELVLAGRNGRLGAGLKPAKVDCRRIVVGPVGGWMQDIDPATREYRCRPGVLIGAASSMTASVRGGSISSLTRLLETVYRRPVVDRTGLVDPFDIDLTFQNGNLRDPRSLAAVSQHRVRRGARIESAERTWAR